MTRRKGPYFSNFGAIQLEALKFKVVDPEEGLLPLLRSLRFADQPDSIPRTYEWIVDLLALLPDASEQSQIRENLAQLARDQGKPELCMSLPHFYLAIAHCDMMMMESRGLVHCVWLHRI